MNLRWTDHRHSNLREADLGQADLRQADLGGVILYGADLREADLHGANLSEAIVAYTVFGDSNLSDVKGLESCAHSGPSYLDYHTLVRSGPLPPAFLRGCGHSDAFLYYLPPLLQQ